MRSKQRAFTLIEIAITLAIIGALSAIALPMYSRYLLRAKNYDATVQIASIATLLKIYWEDNRQFPASLSVVSNPVPIDPWGHPYQYLAIDINPAPNRGAMRKDKNMNPLNSDFDLYSMGPDGRTVKPLTGAHARDDIVRANNGSFIGVATDH